MNKIVDYIGLDVHKDLRRWGNAEKNVRMHRPQAEGAGASKSKHRSLHRVRHFGWLSAAA